MAPPNVLQIVLHAPESGESPRVATASAIHIMNELVVVSFGHPNLFEAPNEGRLQARAFVQVAFPRSSFAAFLKSSVTLISGLPDRDTLGWKELKELVNKEPAK